ncbi:MAG: C69 family dipeptidase [Bacteroidales bacterium]|jgi:dipeptidase|nr:C69 family dipeptidase [Bacteroidales bacterium]
MNKKCIIVLLIGLCMAVFGLQRATACTNFLITKSASTDGSTMVSYAADSHALYGVLYHWPAQDWPAGAMLDVYEWDSGRFMGRIPQISHTYNVVGNMNEHQLVIGETTFGGRSELVDTTGIIDYGSLIYITLQRAKTAREAIHTFHKLVDEYGYASSGESFSIADSEEVWILEMVGKGTKTTTNKKGETYNANKGAVWVARMIPDGYVSGHANQARITTFPLADKKTSITTKQIDKIYNKEVTTVYTPDVVSFAREAGYYEGPDDKFSFSDVYNPVDFGGARFCDLRVWAMFNKVTKGMDAYWDYATGRNIHHPVPPVEGKPLKPENFPDNRMPLWIKPDAKVSVQDMFYFMRDHLEGTELDMSVDVGAGPFASPYRWRPMSWSVDGANYIHERVTATQQTAFSFVSQSRSYVQNEIGGIIWWGVDDAGSSVYAPMYTCMTKAPECYAEGNGDLLTWSETSGFWVFNQVTNLAYTRYNIIHPEIAEKQFEHESKYLKEVPNTDAEAKKLYAQDPKKAVEYLTNYSIKTANDLVKDWKGFYQSLFMKYVDGNRKYSQPVPEGYKYYAPKIDHPKYSDDFYKLIIEKTGDKLKEF